MVNLNTKPEKPSQAEASDSEPGSIAAAATRLLRWGRIAPSGLARVEYISDTSQMAALQRLREGFQQAGIPFFEIALPPRRSASEQVGFLRARLALIESGVVSITGFAHAFSEDTPLLESLRVLNFNRENLADFPLRQIWWMPRDFTQTFGQSIPDLNSWFIIKLRLDEIIVPLAVTSRSEQNAPTHMMSHEEGVKTSNFYASRFRTAVQRQEDLETLWQLWVDAVDPLFAVGRTNEAIHLQEALLQEASENGLSMKDYWTSEQSGPTLLNRMGRIYSEARNPARAEFLFLKALQIQRATLPDDHPCVANSLNYLALLYHNQGRYAEAQPLYKEALQIRRTVLPGSHHEIATSLNNLAGLYYNQGRYAEAEQLHQEALRSRRANLPVNHPDIAYSLNNLALLYDDQGRYTEAEALYQEALQIRRTALPDSHHEIANSLNNLAMFYDKQGRYAEAEPLYQEALQILSAALPEGHPDIKSVDANYAHMKERMKHE